MSMWTQTCRWWPDDLLFDRSPNERLGVAVMKRSLLVTLACFIAAQFGFADWVIIQKSTAVGQEREMTMRIKGSKARADVGADMSMIVDSDSGSTTMLMHQRKVMMKMDAAAVKGIVDAAGKLLGGQDGEGSKLKATGQKEKVREWDAEIVTWESKMGTGKFWVAKDFPDFKEINAISDKLSSALGNPMSSKFPKAEEFGGMVVKSETTMLGQTATTELVSAKKQDVDAAAFEIPADYKEMKLPGFPGGAPGQGK